MIIPLLLITCPISQDIRLSDTLNESINKKIKNTFDYSLDSITVVNPTLEEKGVD